MFGRLRPSTQTISIGLPEALLEDLKRLAHQRDVPYQSLLKIFLAERVAQELCSHS
jgi:predicted DNA binding CopG/RHH family protein